MVGVGRAWKEGCLKTRLREMVFSAKWELSASIVAGVLLGVGALLHMAMGLGWAEGLVWASLAIGMVYGGRAAIEALSEGSFNIDVLMVLGAGFAAGVGHPEEGALLLFLFVLAGALEELAMARTAREVSALSALIPTEAVVFRGGAWVEAEPEGLLVGERIKVRPGERVPVDARVVQGRTSVDQATLTGESMPRDVGEGDTIYGGTINVENPIEGVVVRPARESSVQKVLNLVLEAREQREPVQQAIDRISQPYAIGVTGLSVVIALVWWLVIGREWKDATYTAITFLIVCSPCALVIATPTATLSAIARGARSGVLFKGGQSIERLARIGAVCFDKTGTLTVGKPRLEAVMPVAWSEADRLLSIASALEQESTHPIATAVREGASARGLSAATLERIEHEAGRGMSGVLRDATGAEVVVRLGSYPHTEPFIPVCLRAHTREVLEAIRANGRIGVVVASAGSRGVEGSAGPVGGIEAGGGVGGDVGEDVGGAAVLVLRDVVRPGAKRLVEELHGLGIRPVKMLTGDNRTTAAHVAGELGLDSFEAELMPSDKLRIVGELKGEMEGRVGTKGGKGGKRPGVAVIGDGVNDAPALAAADVAVAIGSIGSDAALESADIVLLNDDLAAVGWAVGLARRARRTVTVNLSFAIGVIVCMGVATLVGSLVGVRVPLGVGVLAHEGGTLLVVANSLRLLWGPAFRAGALEAA
jgi:Cd2+/Zn2+-exporting ATPase